MLLHALFLSDIMRTPAICHMQTQMVQAFLEEKVYYNMYKYQRHRSGLKVIKHFFMLNSAEQEI